ncbi:hypothetical protein [Cryobacterium luteum]|uniref:Uncharacterized protein n=1 Tax=Cryobacterium luteum TaxID=1424661 RepID=A0A1H8CFJ5_9MICO|nr:hypothetical protein [Cryobacterium luteum]TFB89357.1 hypothetical protein E3O10_10895 [Cryobacterium luteum]SEM93732.1 hypothetical protein SAMN05216281_102374 [Cryobacterium luteum]
MTFASATLPELGGWESRSNEGAELVLALTDTPTGAFRPNIVLTSTPSTAPIEAASSVSIAAILTDHPGAQIIAVDLWAEQAIDGRMITASYPAGDLQIVILRWIWATGLRHVHLTASVATHQLLACQPTLSYIATALELTGEMSATQVNTGVAPKLDLTASAAAGQPLELLERVPSFQPYTPPSLEISVAAQGALLAARTTGALARRSPAQQELRDSGLLEGHSRRLSPFALQVVTHWDSGIQLEASTTRSGITRSLRSWTRGESTLFAYSTAPQNEMDAGGFAIEMRPVGQTVDLILRFLGVGPMWSRVMEPARVSVSVLQERLAADALTLPSTPAGTNDAFGRFWNQEWTELRVRSVLSSMRAINTPSAGLLNVGAPESVSGDAVFPITTMPSSAFYTHLLALFETALRG